jgi:uncharacterized lipoprotein YddW (UPF0748 family)
MHKSFVHIFALSLLWCAVQLPLAACRPQPQPTVISAPPDTTRPTPTPPSSTVREVRGVWLTVAGSTVFDSRDNIAQAMRLLRDNGFNVVFPVVWTRGYTLWRSRTMEREFGLPTGAQFGNRDVLAETIQEARANGLAVIPWFEYGFSSFNAGLGAPPGLILERRPEWRAIGRDGQVVVKNGFYWMNALDTNVQNFLTTLVMEVVENYDIDGIQGDDRLPALPTEAGYDAATTAQYTRETGMMPPTDFKEQRWVQWRADKLTDYLRRLRQRVKARKNILISMSPSPYPFGLNEYLQDAPAWINRGFADMMSIQLYRRDLPSYEGLVRQMLSQVDAPKRWRLSPGILGRVDQYIISPTLYQQKVTLNRQQGIPGEVIFFHEALTPNNAELARALRQSVYRQNAVFPKDSLLRP